MKKIYKSLMLLTGTGLMSLALASCGNDKRNTTTPTGGLDLSATVATAKNDQETNGTFTLNTKDYYNRLRYSGYSAMTDAIKKAIYAKEYTAILDVLAHDTLSGISEDTKKLLILTKNNEDLYSLSDNDLNYDTTKYANNYEYIRSLILDAINQSLSNAIFSTSSYEKISTYTDEELDTYYTKYINSRARVGITVTKADLAWTKPATDDDTFITFDKLSTSLLEAGVLDSYLLTQAEKLAAKNALYQIADEEYIWEYDADSTDEDAKTKNSNYLFKDTQLKSSYESTYMTFGTYHAIVVQFNSRREALNTINSLGVDFTDEAHALENYVKLYNACYNYQDAAANENDDRFYYNISQYKNDLSDLSSDIQTLITDTLEAGDYLSEPRNLNDKYVMVYNISTAYSVGNSDEKKKYDDLSEDEQAKFDKMNKYNLIESNSSSYTNKVYNSIIYKLTNDDNDETYLKIFDPLFDYKYSNSYSSIYENTTSKDYQKLNKDGSLVFTLKSEDGTTTEYKVTDFYQDATKSYGNTIILDYFQNEYVVQFADKYVDSDTMEDNEDTLDEQIKTFKKDKNETYPKEVGLETYLLNAYGYDNKDDILKYYYKAATCLSSYKSDNVYKAWATLDDEKTASVGSNAYTISDTAKNGWLQYIMDAGNATYTDLFNINIDHILINIDADADGSPDDPEDFLKDKDDAFVTKFETAVVELAQAIYTEATCGKYGDNSYYQILNYIKEQYTEGGKLLSAEYAGKTWDDFKDFAFLLTVEQLASSGDITQDSVSNFVKPFKEYVENLYTAISTEKVDMDDYENGLFYIYDTASKTGSKLTTAADRTSITIDSLCATEYGYHLLIVNDYSGPASTEFDSSDDTNDYQGNLKILLYEDEDDEKNNIVVYTDSYNTATDAASFNQFFIYYVQKANGQTSSLDSDISSLMSTLFDDAISTYTSSNFQVYLLLEKLDIQIQDSYAKVFNDINLNYYHQLVVDYGEKDQYECWFDADHSWTRPADPTK